MKMTTRTGLTVLALAATALTAASCGGAKTLSRAELIAKADPICRRANHRLDTSKVNPWNLAVLGDGLAATERQVSDELAKLTPPSSMAADWKVIVDGFRRASVGLTRGAEASRIKDTPEILKHGGELTEGQHDRAVAAQRNGFKDCARY
jgi:hypothetical protein